MEEVKACASCSRWIRPEGLGTVGTCGRVPAFLRRWRWLAEADAHDGCEAHTEAKR